MFQNEMPYDPPSQAAWQHEGIDGYAAYKVADSVETHEAWLCCKKWFAAVAGSILQSLVHLRIANRPRFMA